LQNWYPAGESNNGQATSKFEMIYSSGGGDVPVEELSTSCVEVPDIVLSASRSKVQR